MMSKVQSTVAASAALEFVLLITLMLMESDASPIKVNDNTSPGYESA
jgi:hypothetical protein